MNPGILGASLPAGVTASVFLALAPEKPPRKVSSPLRAADRKSASALGFVIAAIVALVLMPALAYRYVQPLHHEMKALAEPSRGWVTQMHVALALQGTAFSDYLDAGTPGAGDRFREASNTQRSASDSLSLLVDRLGPDVQQRFAHVRRLEKRWQEGAESVLANPAPRGARSAAASQDLFESLLLSLARLDEAINAASHQRRRQIENAERVQRTITFILGLVALSAVLVVISLGKQLRSAAAVAERSNAELRAATESRARLIRGISHDLKNPLNAIDGHAQLLLNGLRGDLSYPQEDSVTRIRGAAAMLIRLVDDLVTLSVAESGHLPLETREVEIGELVREICEENRATAQTFCHTLSLSIASDVSRIETDPHRVKQILANLVSNSIKHTPPGGHIQIRVEHAVTRLSLERPERRYLCIAVADDGPGIPPDMMEEVFEEFGGLGNTSDPVGAGLGLAIARRIAGLLDGQITSTNRKDGGAEFSLLLPA